MKTAVECIPNFSEARRPEIMDQIAAEIAKIPQITLANRHSDLDHNRTVLTLLGNPESISEAAFIGAKLTSELIDMNRHTGQHPRIGALDVLPFVPLKNTPMQVCVDIAHQVGKRIGTELGIPVYFYGEAARDPSRKQLENIRRGQFETLRDTINSDPTKKPDEGPALIGPPGAIAIGARKPLIAFNVFLDTANVKIAKKIAKRIRYSSGGFPCVKALGLLVSGQAQVSMNFTDYTVTNLPPVIKAILLEAANYGTAITHTELVGLIPRDAVPQGAAESLMLPEFRSDMIIESYLES